MKKLFLPILIVLLLALAACGSNPSEIVSEAATRGGDVAATAAAVATDVADGPDGEEPTPESADEPTENPTEVGLVDGDLLTIETDSPEGATFEVNPTQPVAVGGSNGTQVSVNANGFEDENGNPPAGDVTINLFTEGVADEGDAAEASEACGEALTVWSYNEMTGLWEEVGAVPTESNACVKPVGNVAVDVSDDAGNDFGLAEGETAEVSIPCEPKPDEVLTVWSYDEATGLWVEEPSVVVEAGETCTAEVSDPSNVVFGTVEAEAASGAMEGQVVNATNNQPLTTAQVCLQDTDQCTSVDDSGNFTFANLPVGEQTVEVTASGYLASSSTATVIAEEAVQQVVALSPELAEGAVRIILTWPTNTDTDSFLRIPNIDNLISYYNRGSLDAEPFANLDTDSYGFGPETITISQLKAGTYEYWVEIVDSPSFAGAQVKVFDSNGLVAEFGGPTDEGPILPWHVFDIDGATGSITSVDALETFK